MQVQVQWPNEQVVVAAAGGVGTVSGVIVTRQQCEGMLRPPVRRVRQVTQRAYSRQHG